MDIDGIQTFLTIAEVGGFTRAGRRLHRSQPAISRRLGLLEQELGAPLFERLRGRTRLAEAGCVGASIEDYTGDRKNPIYDFDLSIARVKAAIKVAHSLPVPIVLTARAENLIRGRMDMADTIRRLQAYEAAGADVVYAPGLRNIPEVRELVRAVKRPVNVVTGWLDPDITLAQLREAGAKRISVGGALARHVLATFVRASRDMLNQGSFAWMRDVVGPADLRTLLQS